jgi:class 3 adenylate cyclase/tetratricopeptide (TPR) repeat protein
MTDVRSWLADMGLDRFAEAFEREEIALEHIPELQESDLETLGLPMGPRKAVLKAAKQLLQAKPTGVEALRSASPDVPHEAERRQITVMFCDLVGSTALSERLDPEDLRALMQAYQQAAGAVIERYDGHVAQYLGDGLMTYFGWPAAHEDDAERAVRAGLEIVDAVKAVEAPEPLQVRVGVATGSVVVGETGAGDASVPKLAVGETPNLAARVQGLAGPDEIVIGPSTRRLVAGTFELEDIGAHTLKGIVEPVRAWRVGGLARTEGRFEAAHGVHLTPLIGREAEIGLLMRRWDLAKEGEGQVVVLCGEPGIGKSRIAQVLRENIADEPHKRLRYQCSPYHVNSALYPIVAQLERAANFTHTDSNEDRLLKMEEVLKETAEDMSVIAPLFASMLSIPTAGVYLPLGISSQKQKELTLQALLDQLLALAANHPVLMIFEDVHWIDPTTQEALNLIVPRIAGHRVLLVITSRPPYQPPWLGLGHVTPMTLTRLGRREAAAIVDRVTGGRALPGEVLDQIVAKTDGVPLFVEELTKTVIESGLVSEGEHGYRLVGTVSNIAIPSTLQDSLMARLDRLASVREIAQIGSCIGREFSYELISAVSALDDNELNRTLEQLVRSELAYRVGTPPTANYTFKHALVQDAAYASLLKTKKHELHARIARVMELRFRHVVEAEPELIARHYTEARLPVNAIPFWLKAGELCIARAAHREALVHLNEGLALVAAQPASAARSDIELAYQMNIGSAYNVLRGWSAPEVKTAYERARELVKEVSDPTHSFNALMGLFYYYNVSGNVNASTPIIEEAANLAQASGISDQLVVAHQGRGQNLLYRGRFVESAASFVGSLAAYDKGRHAYLSNIWGGDFFTYDQAFLALCYWHLGRMQAACDAVRKCIDHTNTFKDPIVHIVGYLMAAVGSLLLRDWESAMTYAAVSETKAEACGMMFHQIFCPILRGCAMVHTGAGQEGHDLMKTHLSITKTSGLAWLHPWLRSHLALSYAMRNEHEIAMDELRGARHDAEALGDTWALGLLDLAEADILEKQRKVDPAAAVLKRTIAHAREQRSKGVELRATTSLARLWQIQGKRREAYELLAPIYGGFTEGFETKDLMEAKALLNEQKT